MFLIGLGLSVGCQDRSNPPISQQTGGTTRPSMETGTEMLADDGSPPSRRETTPPDEGHSKTDESPYRLPSDRPRRTHGAPKRPADSWVLFREAFHDNKDATCNARWVRRNRFEVKTENIRRLTVDLTHLPAEAPKRGPWIIIIDGQGVELTGFTPKPGYTGRVRDLVRSKNGKWTVDRRRLYRIGEKP